MELLVTPEGRATWNGRSFRCALGRAGLSPTKREGDGMTPVGAFAMRRILFRPDRVPAPESGIAVAAISPEDGWCDDPADPLYNRPVRLPYTARHERLWREDHLYDLLVVLGHNDQPVVPGAGSAIFLHVARGDWTPTDGCVALTVTDLLSVVQEARPGDRVVITA